jgi:hypothetical protein
MRWAALLLAGAWLAATPARAAPASWRAEEGAATNLLDQSADTAALTAAFARRDKSIDVRALRLDPDAWLVSLSRWEDSTDVFVAAWRAGAYRIVWRLGDNQPTGALEPLRAWSLAGAQDDCRARAGDAHWADCGPIAPELGRLPDAADGARRFWLNGVYDQEAGETESGQLSFWTWDGHGATPLLVRVYGFRIERDEGPTVAGDVISLPVKDEFATMYVCGACDGRQRVWRFRLTADGVADVGERSLVPELDLIDAAYVRAIRGHPLARLATPAAARVIKRQARQADHGKLGSISWEMTRDRRRLCLSTDLGGAALFTLARADGRTRVAAARYLGDNDCSYLVHWPRRLKGS